MARVVVGGAWSYPDTHVVAGGGQWSNILIENYL